MHATSWSEDRRSSRKRAHVAIVLLIWASVLSVPIAAVSAGPLDLLEDLDPWNNDGGDRRCSEFGGVVPPGPHDYNIIVDVNCTVSSGAVVNGNLKELKPTDPWSINVARSGSVDGNIEEQGPGGVSFDIGGDDYIDGNIIERGDGGVSGTVHARDFPQARAGRINGAIEEWDAGGVNFLISGDFNGVIVENGIGDVDFRMVAGTYNGDVVERDTGNLSWSITGASDMNGNIVERGPGTCAPPFKTGPQPRGNVDCDTP